MDWHTPFRISWHEMGFVFTVNPVPFSILILLFAVAAWGMVRVVRARVSRIKVNLPFGFGETEWVADEAHRQAAWALYVELVTRVSVQELQLEQGLIRETLSSLYSLFETTRRILRDAGPAVATEEGSIGGISINVLNKGLRRFLAKWHPELEIWEAKRKEGISKAEHERAWNNYVLVRKELEKLRGELQQYADALARIVEAVPSGNWFMAALGRIRNRFLGFDVFISYALKDGYSYAKALEEMLTRRNYVCFRDTTEMKIGEDLSESIRQALGRSRMLIVVGTEEAVGSAWVKKEIATYQLQRGGKRWRIVPIEFQDTSGASTQAERGASISMKTGSFPSIADCNRCGIV
jgi:hypothetical protein